MRYLLDTSAILAHYRQETGWEDVQALFEDGDADLFAASISLTELGRRLRDLGLAEPEAEAVLADYRLLFDEIVIIDAPVAMKAFLIGCRSSGRLPLADALIAAAASVREAVLVHRDEHMRVIPTELLGQMALARQTTG